MAGTSCTAGLRNTGTGIKRWGQSLTHKDIITLWRIVSARLRMTGSLRSFPTFLEITTILTVRFYSIMLLLLGLLFRGTFSNYSSYFYVMFEKKLWTYILWIIQRTPRVIKFVNADPISIKSQTNKILKLNPATKQKILPIHHIIGLIIPYLAHFVKF